MNAEPTPSAPPEPGFEHGAAGLRPRLLFIDQLRALAALYVAIYHALLVLWPNGAARDEAKPPWFLWWADHGHVGVSVFIVLSGYSLTLGIARKGTDSAGPYLLFMRKRARRLLPPYWAALAASVLLLILAPANVSSGPTNLPGEFAKGPVPFRSVVAFALLMQDFFRVPSPNSPMWSIAVEWHLYFLFPLLIFVGCRYGMRALLAGTVVVGLALHFLLRPTSASGTTPHFLALFTFGIVSAFAVSRKPLGDRFGAATARLAWATIATAALSFALLEQWEVGADLLAGALVALALWMLGSRPPAEPSSSRRPSAVLASVGLISYSIYLVHSPAEKVVWKLAVSKLDLAPVPAFLVLATVGIAVALAGAVALFLLVERRSMQWSQSLRAPAPAPAD